MLLCFLSMRNASATIARIRITEQELDYLPVGEAIFSPTSDEHGGAIDISFDGDYVAIGSPHSGTIDQGEVRVYQSIIENEIFVWKQLGNAIIGETDSAHIGLSVALSSGGTTLAIGSLLDDDNKQGLVEVFRFDEANRTWISLHKIPGSNEGYNFGKILKLSSNGKILAVGGNNVVRIYRCDQTSCEEKGSSIITNEYETTIRDIDLSSSGNSLVIGSVRNELSSLGPGFVKLYTFQSDNWIKSAEFSGEIGDGTGYSVSLSGDGEIVAFGALGVSCQNGTGNCGSVKIFSKDGLSYSQIGADIQGNPQSRLMGINVDLTDDGRSIIITSLNEKNEAMATIYSNVIEDNPNWTMIQTFVGGAIESASSMSAALNADGDRSIFLSPSTDGTDQNIVRVFAKNSENSNGSKSSKKGSKKSEKSFKTKGGTKSSKKKGSKKSGKKETHQAQFAPTDENCVNDKTFKFNQIDTPQEKQKCKYIGQQDVMIQQYCSDKLIAEKCKKACKLCED